VTPAQHVLEDVFRYAERMRNLSYALSAGLLVVSAVLLLHLTQMLSEPSIGRLLLVLLFTALVGALMQHWRALRAPLSMFVLQAGAHGLRWQVAPRDASEAFVPVPARCIRHAEAPAPAGVCWDLETYARRYPEVWRKLAECRQAHGRLTNHDAANLLLLALSMR